MVDYQDSEVGCYTEHGVSGYGVGAKLSRRESMTDAFVKEMAEAIQNNGGLVLQFIGDEIYAVFGAPLYLKNHPRCAVAAALDMRRRLSIVNRKIAADGHAPLNVSGADRRGCACR